MLTKLNTPRVSESSVAEGIDGEIYISLPNKALRFRGALMMAMLGLAGASAALAGYLHSASVQDGGKYSKGTTQCPGMTPAQKAAPQAKKG